MEPSKIGTAITHLPRLISESYQRSRAPSLYAQQADVEDERRVRRNGVSVPSAAVCQVWRNDQAALPSDSHAGYTLIPAFDDLAGTHDERKARQRIELPALAVR